MTPLDPCPFCKEQPAMNRPNPHYPEGHPSGNKFYWAKCVSAQCSRRIVETRKRQTEEAAIADWNYTAPQGDA